MGQLIHLKSISDLMHLFQLGECCHPLLAVVDFSQTSQTVRSEMRITSDFYSIMFKSRCFSGITYGRKPIDFNEGSLICMAPNQVISIDQEEEQQDNLVGWGVFFHPDLIRNTSLGLKINDYSFFSYERSEALHLSEKEKMQLRSCVDRIREELGENIDEFSQNIVVSNIEILLNYCNRFYGRQFITRKSTNRELLTRVETYLMEYFEGNQPQNGLPSVKIMAEHVNLSPGYLSDLLKKETGLSAQEHIHFAIIERAKNSLLGSELSVSEIAFQLGFEYPQYFSRLFKQKTGLTPLAYRSHN